MSIPPQLIRVKRKRVDEAPVTFLQLDDDTKRHRSGNNWVYQRREATVAPNGPVVSRHDSKPVIHVSKPTDDHRDDQNSASGAGSRPSTAAPTSPSVNRTLDGQHHEQRKFHVSRAMLQQAAASQNSPIGSPQQARPGPTLFVERIRKKIVPKSSLQNLAAKKVTASLSARNQDTLASNNLPEPIEQKKFKRPGVRSREPSQDTATRNPLPSSLANRQNEDLSKITTDMNQWVLNEIGANLQSMELEKKKEAERRRFRPKAPEKRYQERNPDIINTNSITPELGDTLMADASEEEGDDDEWVIEEYVRIPAHTMAVDVLPSDVGLLVLDGEEENLLFYGSLLDEDDEFGEDDEDENAENYYTADYPEDEVDSEDEFDRQAYLFRNGNASDDEEYDDDEYHSDSDKYVMEGDGDDDDARMDRIREFMRRNRAAA